MKKIGIVGAGPGGLAAGILLASKGFQVKIFEAESRVGGRNGSFSAEGYTFDIGPTFFMMPFVLEEIFAAAGKNLHDYVEMKLLDPYYQLLYADGSRMEPSFYPEKVKESIAGLNKNDVAGYQKYMQDNEKKMKYTLPVLQRPYTSWSDLMNEDIIRLSRVLNPQRSLWKELGTYFKDDRVKVGFTFQSKYLGMSPFNCPSLFSILPYTEYKWGVYHIMGGLNQLSLAMARVFQELGGEIELNREVTEIKIKEGKATGIKVAEKKNASSWENQPQVKAEKSKKSAETQQKISSQKSILKAEKTKGEEAYNQEEAYYKFDEIIMNADFAWGMQNLIPNEKRKKYSDENLAKKRYSCSTFMLYLGVDRQYNHLKHNNVFLASDYRKNFLEIESDKKLSRDPSFYLQNATLTDPGLAPEGHNALYLLVPVANLQSQIDWQAEAEDFRSLMIDKLKSRAGLTDLEKHIQYEKMITPLDWQNSLRVGYGATFNLGHNLKQMLIFRPRNKFEEFENLWLVGGGTNPGSGLPTIYESGRITANLLARKHGLDYNFDRREKIEETFASAGKYEAFI